MFFDRADMFLLGICIVSALFGTAMVYKAATGMVAAGADMNPTKLVFVQLLSMFLGIGAFVVLTVLDADLLGAPIRVVVSPKTLSRGCFELSARDKSFREDIDPQFAVSSVFAKIAEMTTAINAKVPERL